jgi:hypothetical protein
MVLPLLSILGCGGGSGSSPAPAPAKATITISPSGTTVYVTANQNRQFSATVSGISNTTPIWSILGTGSQWSVNQTGLVKGPLSGNQGGDLQVSAADGTTKTQYMQSINSLNPSLNSNGINYGQFTLNGSSYAGRINFGYDTSGMIDPSSIIWTTAGMTNYAPNPGTNELYFNAPPGANCSAKVSVKDMGAISYQTNLISFVVPSLISTPLTSYSIIPPTNVYLRDTGTTAIDVGVQPITGNTGIINISASGSPFSSNNSAQFNLPGVQNTQLIIGGSYSTHNSTPVSQEITLTGVSLGLANQISNFNVTINPSTYPDFGIVGTSPYSLTITKGNSASISFISSIINGFNGPIILNLVEVISSNIDVPLAGFTLSPISIQAGSTNGSGTVSVNSSVASGTYYLIVQGYDGIYRHNWSLAVNVN